VAASQETMASRPTDDLGAISTLVGAALAGPKPPVQRSQALHRGPDSSRPCLQGPSFRPPPLSGRRLLNGRASNLRPFYAFRLTSETDPSCTSVNRVWLDFFR
jgi:hypothetical protein